jgi:hypothetical protein
LRWRSTELARYVYQPWEPPVESPRPYLHPLRTLGGKLVSLYRPHDHVWHKGLAWSFCNVDEQNFWGGPTYVRGQGYRQLDNNGSIRHESWTLIDREPNSVRCSEQLRWFTHDEQELLAEERDLAGDVAPELEAWRLALRTRLTNRTEQPIVFGSPSTRGRDNAGYGGLFWRGPRSFSDGWLIGPDGEGRDELMGTSADWMAFVGLHDGAGTASTVLFVDHRDNPGYPTQWFARSQRYAVLGPAPFFSREFELAPGGALELRYDVVIADGPSDAQRRTSPTRTCSRPRRPSPRSARPILKVSPARLN